MPEPVDPPTFTSDLKETHVEVDGLHTFAGAVDAEVDQNFKPHADRLASSYAKGVPFGAVSRSGDVHAAKLKYHDCLVGVTEQLTAYVNASKILTTAVREIAKRYSDADALSEAAAKEVSNALGGAIRAAQAEQAAADAAAQARQRGRMRAE